MFYFSIKDRIDIDNTYKFFSFFNIILKFINKI